MSSAVALPPPSSNRILAATSEHWRIRAASSHNRLPELPTELLSVSPEFIAQLRNEIAPKRKGGRLPLVLTVMLLLVTVMGVLASDRSTREFAMDKSEVITARYFESRRAATEPVANVATAATPVAPAATPVASAASPAVSPAPTTEVVQQPVLVVPAKAPKMVSPSPKKRPAGRPVSAIRKGARGAVLVVGSSLKSNAGRS